MTMARAAGIDLSLPPSPVHTLPRLLSTRRRACGEYGCRNANAVCNCCLPGLVWPWLSTASLAQQSNSAGASNPLPQAEASPDDIEGGQMFATTCGFCHQRWWPPCGQRSETVEVRAQRRISSSSASRRARWAPCPPMARYSVTARSSRSWPTFGAATRAFSSEVGTGSRQENASNQRIRQSPASIPSKRKRL